MKKLFKNKKSIMKAIIVGAAVMWVPEIAFAATGEEAEITQKIQSVANVAAIIINALLVATAGVMWGYHSWKSMLQRNSHKKSEEKENLIENLKTLAYGLLGTNAIAVVINLVS